MAGFAGSASAADLGGNCCADLEERIAELEATTARKGNRKVSLTVSGWVTQNVMYWDDGEESNVYVYDSGETLASNVKFTGSAQISPEWSAGYVLHLEAIGSDGLLLNQNGSTTPQLLTGVFRGVAVAQSYWYVKSEKLGKVSVGLVSQASDNTAILVDGSGSLVPANFVAFDWNNFGARDAAGNIGPTLGIGGLAGCSDCNGVPLNAVRYDSPTFGGFSVSASWGEDDFWDVAARYAGEFSGFKLAVATAYSESRDSVDPFNQLANTEFWQVGAYVQHVASGLFLYGAYGDIEDADDVIAGEDNSFWYLKAGIRGKWTPHGATVLYAEYEQFDNNRPTAFTTSSEVDLWGLGVVQEIDAAAMSMWLTYRHIESEANLFGIDIPVQDFD